MKKIMILGSAGAGKSTMATALGELTGYCVYYLDTLFWLPNWQAVDKPIMRDKVNSIIEEKDSWIMDGNYRSVKDRRIEAADTIIFLDENLITCLYRVIKRRIQYNNRQRVDRAEGCHENIDVDFLIWIIKYHMKKKGIIQELLKQQVNKDVFILKGYKKKKEFMENLRGSLN